MGEPALLVRHPVFGERSYVYQTARAAAVARNGSRFADFQPICQMVDEVLSHCEIRVALFDGVRDDRGRPEIHGFVARDRDDGSVEFVYLKRLYRDMTTTVLAEKVMRGLLGDEKDVVLRRAPTAEALKAIVAANYKPVVRPRSI